MAWLTSRPRVTACLAGAAALALYVPTLYPGVASVGGDSPKFQYLGSVLGTAHPPGYPLYIFVSYAFSKLPIGTMAYRMNLLSAVLSSAAVAMVFLTLVRLRCHTLVAVAAALGLGFGRHLWARSLSAEVYTLGAALTALIILLAVRWSESGRRRDLYLTAAAFGLSLGNHLTIATIAPALALFVLTTRPRSVTIRTTSICAGLGLLGLAQYGFIMLRTWQQAPYVEAQATTLGELVDVMRATKYSDLMFEFSLTDLFTERIPRVSRVLVEEMGIAGVLAGIVGLLAAAWRRRPTAVLLGLSFAGIAALTLTVNADIEGFLLSGFVPAWLLAGIGAEFVRSLASKTRPGRIAAGVAIALVPVMLVRANYKVNDHHRRTYEIRYLGALFRQLEARAAFVSESYLFDQMLLYMIAGEQAARGREVKVIDPDLPAVRRHVADGYTLYAFENQRYWLDQLGFRFEMVQLSTMTPGPSGLRLEPIDMAPMPLGRLVSYVPCEGIGNVGWHDAGEMARGERLDVRLDNSQPFEAIVVMYVAGGDLGMPRLDAAEGPVAPRLTIATYRSSRGADGGALAAALSRDGVPDVTRFTAQPIAHRIELRVNDQGQFSRSTVWLGGRPTAAAIRATVDMNSPRRAIVCGAEETAVR
jgi:hypothetical protein